MLVDRRRRVGRHRSATQPAWNVLAWFATLVVLADGLNKVGFVGWFGQARPRRCSPGIRRSVVMTLAGRAVLPVHYMFASLTAHTTAVLPVDPRGRRGGRRACRSGRSCCCSASRSGIMGVLTPYATGPAPVYFGSGFIAAGISGGSGLIFGLLFLGALLVIGVPWLVLLGV